MLACRTTLMSSLHSVAYSEGFFPYNDNQMILKVIWNFLSNMFSGGDLIDFGSISMGLYPT